MILGIATEKHGRNRRHFQQLVIVKHGVTTTKCHSVENVPRHEPRLHRKRKKTIRRFISTFMPFFYILTVLFWTSYAQAINRSFHTDAVSWTILGCLWSEVLCGYIFFTILPLFVKFNCEINIGFKSPSIT